MADLKDVVNVLRPTKRKWEDLGLELGLKGEDLEAVNADHNRDGVDKCLVEMLKHWLRMNYDDSDSKPPTWNNLANAVENIGDGALARKIRDK